ncbi:MAG: TonB-dependent receptor [Thermoleophilia bacterium]|nr:TonB-dependent receptor [Thermoleophilia bacterium]
MRDGTRGLLYGGLLTLALIIICATAFAAVTGVVSGVVLDAETSVPLSGANVAIVDTGLATVTDDQGRFTITNVPPGSHAVKVSLIGYRDAQIVHVDVVQGQVTELRAELAATVVEAVGAEAIITAPRVSLKPGVTSTVYVVTDEDEQLTLSQPNDRYQFPGLVFAQPGSVPDSTFYPHVRGARANQVGYFLDGIPITEPNANVFATNIVSVGLDRLEFFTGGYPAEYGGWTGGIVNQVVKRGDQLRGGLVDVGAGSPYDYGGLLLETGDVDDKANWYYGQYNWHSEFPENMFTSEAPTVSDHITKITYDAGKKDDVTLLASHGYARYLMPWERMFTFDPTISDWIMIDPTEDMGRQGHDLASLTLNHTVSSQSYWTLRLSRLAHFLHLELGDLENMYWQQRNERMFTGQFDYELQAGDHRLRAGVWQIDSDNNSQYSVMLFPANFISNNDTKNTQAYVQDSWDLNDQLVLTLGGRLDQMAYDRPAAEELDLDEASPRVGLTYELSDSLLLRGAYGKYVEFPRANLLAYEVAGLDIGWSDFLAPAFPARPQVDRGRDLGVEWKVGGGMLLNATYFERDSRQMTQRWQGVLHDDLGNWVLDDYGNPILSDALEDFDLFAPAWFAANGTGTSRGVELKLDAKLNSRLRGWLAYTYLNAEATSPRDNIYPFGFGFLDRTDPEGLAEEFPLEWSQQHTATLAFRYKTGKLSINPWVTYGSGFPYGQSGLDAGGSDAAHIPNPDYDPGDPSSPEELTIPENYANGVDASDGFVTPGDLETGTNLTLSLNFDYEIGPGRGAYFQIYNLFNRDDVTSYAVYHPQTGGLIGQVEGDQVRYVPFSKTPPRFFAFGVRQEF